MPISNQDDINHRELARILGITGMAMLRGGRLTDRQKRRIDEITRRAKEREDKKRTGKK
ncbi:hypothetical protein [Streptomyces synnematoformans]|uniref:Uncharacterized protein n=1 Tax=Streptomyces synnematoformans TaxID=415721 RepID=A0ABN2Y0C9_9ACTN